MGNYDNIEFMHNQNSLAESNRKLGVSTLFVTHFFMAMMLCLLLLIVLFIPTISFADEITYSCVYDIKKLILDSKKVNLRRLFFQSTRWLDEGYPIPITYPKKPAIFSLPFLLLSLALSE